MVRNLERLKTAAEITAHGGTMVEQEMTDQNAPGRTTAAETVRIIPSGELLMGSKEIIIRHGADDYRLRLTRAGKLILNK